MLLPYHFRDRPGGLVMVSPSRDGDLIVDTVERFGLRAVRGSSGRDGGDALRAMIDGLRARPVSAAEAREVVAKCLRPVTAPQMDHAVFASLLALGLFVGMLLALELGRRIGARRLAREAPGSQGTSAGGGTIEGAVFWLMGLLLAFTFSGALARFDTRRELIVEETNAIGTAYLRLDLLPAAAQPEVREGFRKYVDSRLALYRNLPDIEAAKAELARSAELQHEIWSEVVAALPESPPATAMLVLPALNAMIDITTTRTMAAQTHPPAIVFAMLFVLALASFLLAGYDMVVGQGRSWIHVLVFATTLAVSVYVILDIEYPRLGLIRVDAFDQALAELRASMK